MKTWIEIKNDYNQGRFKKGEAGYIDGYVRGGDNEPCAVVVIDDEFDLVPIYNLRVR